MKRKFIPLVIAVLALGVVAQQQRQADQSAPDVERLRAHVSHLASEKLEGRRTGSRGATLAAEYIAGEFARYHLRRSVGRDLPGMSILEADSPRRYMQEFPYVAGVELGRNNSLRVIRSAPAAPLTLSLGVDWVPLGFSSSANLTNAPAAFVGYGIKADELNHDDYANAKAKGRIAVAFAGSPDGDNPHGPFARHADVRWKAIAARNSGATALVIIAREENFKDDPLARLTYNNSAGEAGLPVIALSRQAAAQLFELTGVALLDLFEKKLQAAIQTARNASRSSGYDITLSVQPPQNFTLSLSTEVTRRSAPAYNVVGIIEGSDPVLKNEAIVIGAHYDHLGRGGQGSLAAREGEIHHGADDNASGVAGVIELARIFSADGARTKRTLVLVAFGGEEEGLLGSNYYVNHPVWPLDKTVAMINMDMIGRMKGNQLMIAGVGTAKEWRELIAAENLARAMNVTASGSGARAEGVNVKSRSVPVVVGANGQPVVHFDPAQQFALTLNEDGYGPSDHSSFYAKRVPVLFFFTGTHDDYHKPSDTAEKINYEDEARVLAFVAGLVRAVDGGAQRPTYAVTTGQPQGRSMGFRVYLGTIPNYSEGNDGLKLDGVRPDSPAEKAGLKPGDRVVKMAGREVRNVQDYTYVLGEMKAGQEYEVEVVRGSETLKLKITPTGRK